MRGFDEHKQTDDRTNTVTSYRGPSGYHVTHFAGDNVTVEEPRNQIAELEEEWRVALREAAAAVADEPAGREMRQSPPGEINGWEHITADSDGFALAYEGWSQGSTHVVVAAYRDSEGVFQVDEFAYPD